MVFPKATFIYIFIYNTFIVLFFYSFICLFIMESKIVSLSKKPYSYSIVLLYLVEAASMTLQIIFVKTNRVIDF